MATSYVNPADNGFPGSAAAIAQYNAPPGGPGYTGSDPRVVGGAAPSTPAYGQPYSTDPLALYGSGYTGNNVNAPTGNAPLLPGQYVDPSGQIFNAPAVTDPSGQANTSGTYMNTNTQAAPIFVPYNAPNQAGVRTETGNPYAFGQEYKDLGISSAMSAPSYQQQTAAKVPDINTTVAPFPGLPGPNQAPVNSVQTALANANRTINQVNNPYGDTFNQFMNWYRGQGPAGNPFNLFGGLGGQAGTSLIGGTNNPAGTGTYTIPGLTNPTWAQTFAAYGMGQPWMTKGGFGYLPGDPTAQFNFNNPGLALGDYQVNRLSTNPNFAPPNKFPWVPGQLWNPATAPGARTPPTQAQIPGQFTAPNPIFGVQGGPYSQAAQHAMAGTTGGATAAPQAAANQQATTAPGTTNNDQVMQLLNALFGGSNTTNNTPIPVGTSGAANPQLNPYSLNNILGTSGGTSGTMGNIAAMLNWLAQLQSQYSNVGTAQTGGPVQSFNPFQSQYGSVFYPFGGGPTVAQGNTNTGFAF